MRTIISGSASQQAHKVKWPERKPQSGGFRRASSGLPVRPAVPRCGTANKKAPPVVSSNNEHKSGSVITGSSNLTDAGLGTRETANYEFNVLLRDFEDVKFATAEFEKLWKESVSILPKEIGGLKKETFLNDEFTPYEIYIKFLIEYFGKSIEFDPSSVSDLPKGFMRLTYQVDAVNQGFELLRRHNGFFLADVVGLGKTVVAARIAKKFFYTNGYPSHVSRVLVVVPPALKDNWQETLDQFGLSVRPS